MENHFDILFRKRAKRQVANALSRFETVVQDTLEIDEDLPGHLNIGDIAGD